MLFTVSCCQKKHFNITEKLRQLRQLEAHVILVNIQKHKVILDCAAAAGPLQHSAEQIT